MDKSTLNPITRIVGASALTALVLYAGMALERAQPPFAESVLLVFATLVGSVAAVWGLVRLGANTAATWTVLVLLGTLPAATFVGWMMVGEPAGVLIGILWLNLVAGLGTLALTGYELSTRSAARTRRTARA